MDESQLNVVITGCGRGIGLALAESCARRGDCVAATTRFPDRSPGLRGLSSQLDASRLRILPLDVTQRESVHSAYNALRQAWPRVDILINNAGVMPEAGDEAFEDLDLDALSLAFEVNVRGAALVTQTFLPLLRNAPQPRIINLGSGAGSISGKNDHARYAYSISKAALNLLTRSLAHEYHEAGITVVSISPGWVQTDMGGPEADLKLNQVIPSLVQTIHSLAHTQTGKFLDRHGASGTYAW